jgi:hypothetical protein
MDVTNVYKRIGRSKGIVIFVYVWKELAPSSCADSYRDSLMEVIPAINTIIVLPYHIQKLMKQTINLVSQGLAKKLTLADLSPLWKKSLIFIAADAASPVEYENNLLKKIAIVAAVITLGKYIKAFITLNPLSLSFVSVNQAERSNARRI